MTFCIKIFDVYFDKGKPNNSVVVEVEPCNLNSILWVCKLQLVFRVEFYWVIYKLSKLSLNGSPIGFKFLWRKVTALSHVGMNSKKFYCNSVIGSLDFHTLCNLFLVTNIPLTEAQCLFDIQTQLMGRGHFECIDSIFHVYSCLIVVVTFYHFLCRWTENICVTCGLQRNTTRRIQHPKNEGSRKAGFFEASFPLSTWQCHLWDLQIQFNGRFGPQKEDKTSHTLFMEVVQLWH